MVSRIKHQESGTSSEFAPQTDDEEYPPSYESVVYGSMYGPQYESNNGEHVNLSEQQSSSSFDPDSSAKDWTTQLIPNGSSSKRCHKANKKEGKITTNVRYSTISGSETVQIQLRTDTGNCPSDGVLLDSDSNFDKGPASYLCFSFAVCLICNPCFGFAAIVCACISNYSKKKGNYALAESLGTKALWIGVAGIVITFTVAMVLLFVELN